MSEPKCLICKSKAGKALIILQKKQYDLWFCSACWNALKDRVKEYIIHDILPYHCPYCNKLLTDDFLYYDDLCDSCGRKLHLDEDEIYCQACYGDAREVKCDCCGDFINPDEIEMYCRACMEEALATTKKEGDKQV